MHLGRAVLLLAVDEREALVVNNGGVASVTAARRYSDTEIGDRWSSRAIELAEQYSETDPLTVNFVDLRRWVMELEGFDDDPNRCGEKILEAIQGTWIEEAS